MNWSISTRSIERIRSFEQAKKHWEGQEEWKNELTSWRPLAGRREQHKRLVQHESGKSYACVLYNTALVTYHDDGSVSLRTYNSQSSVMFADCVSPQGCTSIAHRGVMFWQVRTDKGTRFYAEGKSPLILTPTKAGNWWLATQAVRFYDQKTDLKKAAAVRKKLKLYSDWYKLTARLGGLPRQHFTRQPQSDETCHAWILDRASDPDAFMELALEYGSPQSMYAALYEVEGARYKVAVPHSELPKEIV